MVHMGQQDQIGVRMDRRTHSQIERAAKHLGVSKSDIVRMAIKSQLSDAKLLFSKSPKVKSEA